MTWIDEFERRVGIKPREIDEIPCGADDDTVVAMSAEGARIAAAMVAALDGDPVAALDPSTAKLRAAALAVIEGHEAIVAAILDGAS